MLPVDEAVGTLCGMTEQRGSQPEPSASPPQRDVTRLHVWQIQAVRDVLFIAAVFGLVWLGYAMRSVTVPLLVAQTLAYLFEPLIARLTRNPKTSRPLIVGGLLLTVGLLVILMLSILIPLVIGQSVKLTENIRQGKITTALMQAQSLIPENYRSDYMKALQWLGPAPAAETQPATQPDGVNAATMPEVVLEPVIEPIDEARTRAIVREELDAAALRTRVSQRSAISLPSLASGGARAALDLLGAVVQLGLLAFLIPFYFYFFSVSYPAVVRFGRGLLPVKNRGRVLELIGKMDRAVAGFVRGRIVICLITGVMLAIGWMICGVPYSLVLGLVVGAFFAVPFLSVIGLPLAIGFLFVDQMGQPPEMRMSAWSILLWPFVVMLVVQAIESYVLTPIIAGKATNLDPVTILVAVLACGSIGGVYGMFLAIPLAACAKILLTDVVLPRIKEWTQGRADDPLPFRSD